MQYRLLCAGQYPGTSGISRRQLDVHWLFCPLGCNMLIERAASKTAASRYKNQIPTIDWYSDGGNFCYPGIGRRAHGEPSGAPESLPVLLSSFPSPPFLQWIGKIALPLQDQRPPSVICWRLWNPIKSDVQASRWIGNSMNAHLVSYVQLMGKNPVEIDLDYWSSDCRQAVAAISVRMMRLPWIVCFFPFSYDSSLV